MITRILIALLLCSSTVFGQESPRNEKNSAGTLINQDYFSAARYPDVNYLLFSVEKHHLNKRVWSDFYSAKYGAVLDDVVYALERFPNHPKALLLLGSLAKIRGNVALAIPYYERAIALYPQYAMTHAQYGSYLVDIGRTDTGIERLKKAIEINPEQTLAHAALAKAYLKNGNLELARQAAERAKAFGYRGKIGDQDSED